MVRRAQFVIGPDTSADRALRSHLTTHQMRLALAICLMAIAPGHVPAQQPPVPAGLPFRVVSIEEIGHSLELGMVISSGLGPDGSVYLIDRSTAEVFHLTPAGSLAWRSGRKGGGPGEFQLPYRVIPLPSGGVFVYDLATDRLTLLDSLGKYVRNAAFSIAFETVDNIVALPDGGFAVSGVARDVNARKSAVHIFDDSLRYVRSFGPLPPTRTRQTLANWGAGNLSRTPEGDLLFVRRLPYEIYRFTPTGILRQVIHTPFDWKHTADDVVGTQLVGTRTITRINLDLDTPLIAVQIEDGIILGGHAHKDLQAWDFFSADGRFLKSVRVPNAWHSIVGYDAPRSVLWLVGESNLEPVLLRVVLSEHTQHQP